MINDAHVSWKSRTPLQGLWPRALIIPHLKHFMSVCGLVMFAGVRALFCVLTLFFLLFLPLSPL